MVTFPQFPPQKNLYRPLPHSATCPAHLILLNLITRTILGEQYRSLCSMKFAYVCVYIYIDLHCGILLKTYGEIGGYKMCAGSGSKWVPITVLDLRVLRKAKNYLSSRVDFIVSLRTPLRGGCRLVKLWCVSAATWLLHSRGLKVVLLRGKKLPSCPNIA